MSGVSFSLSLDAQIGAGFTALRRAGADPRPLLDRIGGLLADSSRERFSEGVGPDGQSWQVSQRAALEGGKTLVLHGYLRDSITHTVDGAALEVGTNIVYGAIHQFGGTISFHSRGGSVDLPARPYLGLSAADQQVIIDETDAVLLRAWGRA